MPSPNEKTPVRVLHVVGDSRFGGAAWIILRLGQVAQAEGWQVDVLTTDPVFKQSVRDYGLGLVELDVIRRKIRPFWDLGGLFRLSGFLRRESYRIVHTHTSKGGFVGRLAAQLAGVPVIVHTAHGFAFHEGSPRSIRMFYSTLERIAARWCDRIVSVSQFHRSWAIELGMCDPARILAIPNGVTDITLKTGLDRAESRRRLGAQDDDLVVLSMSRLADDKGLDHLIRAAAILPRKVPRIRIFIAGDGPVRPQLEELARDLGVTDRVAFLGFRQDVGDLLAACDLVALPSLREGLSIALLEAMAAGRPIVATSIGSHREMASQADIARLVPPADVQALSQAIQQLAADPTLRARLGSGGRALFEAGYTEERMLNAYQQLYFDLLDEKSASGVGRAHESRVYPIGFPVWSNEKSEGTDAAPSTKDAPSSNAIGRTPVIRKAEAADLPGIVRIHQRAFKQFFLTRLGGEFLRRYYELVLSYDAGIILVSENRGYVDGFVCGFVDPAEFYRFMWGNKWAFLLPVLSALVRHPSLAAKVRSGVQRIQMSASAEPAGSCELSSIAVSPDAAAGGLGKALVGAFLEEAWSTGAQCVYLTTDADGNGPANALYRKTGFRQTQRFQQRKGRWMNAYVIQRMTANDSYGMGS